MWTEFVDVLNRPVETGSTVSYSLFVRSSNENAEDAGTNGLNNTYVQFEISASKNSILEITHQMASHSVDNLKR